MNPTAFSIFGIDVQWYGIIITFAMVISLLLSMRSGKKQGYLEDDFLDIGMVVFPVAVVFARIYYVVFNLDSYDTIWQMIDIRQGGLAIHGGLIGGVLAGFIVTKVKGMSFFKTADVIAPFLPLAQAIGRWGNYINQEAYGRETTLPWAITVHGRNVHPTFLYESIWNFLIFLFLLRKSKNKEYDGQLVAVYLILYSFGRFFIEGLRTDSLMLGNLRMAQIISLAMIALGVVLMLIRKDKPLVSAYAHDEIKQSGYYFAKDIQDNGVKEPKQKIRKE